MHPILFEPFGFKIYAYGAMVALAFLAGIALIVYRARKAGERADDYLEAAIWFIIAGIAGARLFYFIWYPKLFLQDPLGSLLSQGGLVWYGGVIGVLLASWIFTRIKKIPLGRFCDIVAPAAALGLAIGRIGCLLAGCCYGSVCDLPWAVRYPQTHETHGVPVHPTQLYETFLMLLAAGLLMKLDKNKPFAGFTTAWFFIFAGIVRFALEYLRGDKLIPLDQFTLSASQIVSLIGIAAGVAVLALNRRKSDLKKALGNKAL